MQKEISFKGKKLSYTVTGDGPAVLLLHGFAEDSSVWKNQVEQLQNSYRLLFPDLPGSGRSDLNDDMSMEGLAAAVHAILKEEEISTDNSITCIGHSMGGYVTLALVEKWPELFNGFGLFHSTSYADTAEKIATRKKGIAAIKEKGGAAFLEGMIPKLFSPGTQEKHPTLVASQLKGIRNFTDEALIAYYEGMIERPDRTEVLKTATVPVLFVIGEHDTAVSPGDMLKQTHVPSIAVMHVLHESGHMGMLEEAEKSRLILEQFLVLVAGRTSPDA